MPKFKLLLMVEIIMSCLISSHAYCSDNQEPYGWVFNLDSTYGFKKGFIVSHKDPVRIFSQFNLRTPKIFKIKSSRFFSGSYHFGFAYFNSYPTDKSMTEKPIRNVTSISFGGKADNPTQIAYFKGNNYSSIRFRVPFPTDIFKITIFDAIDFMQFTDDNDYKNTGTEFKLEATPFRLLGENRFLLAYQRRNRDLGAIPTLSIDKQKIIEQIWEIGHQLYLPIFSKLSVSNSLVVSHHSGDTQTEINYGDYTEEIVKSANFGKYKICFFENINVRWNFFKALNLNLGYETSKTPEEIPPTYKVNISYVLGDTGLFNCGNVLFGVSKQQNHKSSTNFFIGANFRLKFKTEKMDCNYCRNLRGYIIHKVKIGDTLKGLARRYYGNPNLWTKILNNNPQIRNPNILEVGMKLKIK